MNYMGNVMVFISVTLVFTFFVLLTGMGIVFLGSKIGSAAGIGSLLGGKISVQLDKPSVEIIKNNAIFMVFLPHYMVLLIMMTAQEEQTVHSHGLLSHSYLWLL